MPDTSPYVALSRLVPPRTSAKRALLSLSRSIEARALASAPDAELWVSLQHARFHSGRTRRLHEALAAAGVTVRVYGVGVRDGRLGPPTLRCHDVSEFSPLASEWDVLLVTPDAGLGLVAQEVDPSAVGPLVQGPAVADLDRRFDWVVSEDRADVVYAAASLPGDSFVLGRDFGVPRRA